ncbi:hypothetical protein ACFV8T_17225 [Streptomyces sp. NPDC059832]
MSPDRQSRCARRPLRVDPPEFLAADGVERHHGAARPGGEGVVTAEVA